jgi:hypothetical protein
MAYDVNQTMLDQLLHQFDYSENILKLIGITSDALQDTFDAAEFIQTAVTLDDFAGQQLEFWGELLGVKRPRAQQDVSTIFTICELGEAGDVDNKTGFEDDSDPDVTTGGYLTTHEGLFDVDDPTAKMSDVDYRRLIRQKSLSFRKRMTHTNLYDYLLAFGSRCKIDADNPLENWIEPQNYYDLNDWEKNYTETRGFSPSGIKVKFLDNLTDIEDI